MIFTSHYRGPQKGAQISISIYPPQNWKGAHLPLFAPSKKLFDLKPSPEEYSRIFAEEMQAKNQLINIWLSKRAEDITLNCYERLPNFCHRHLVGQIIKSKRPDLWGGELEESTQPSANKIKALTLHQPWAALVGRHKHYETRSWGTPYRGKLAIHAAKRQKDTDAWISELGDLLPAGELAYGAVVAVCDLTDCIRMGPKFIAQQSPTEIRCGLWEPSRYAWKLENVRIFKNPILCRGYQGLWDWEQEILVLSSNPISCFPDIENIENPENRWTWVDAPPWWNPHGEKIAEVRGDRVILEYGGRLIPLNELRLVES